jgi:hypothetical protein
LLLEIYSCTKVVLTPLPKYFLLVRLHYLWVSTTQMHEL